MAIASIQFDSEISEFDKTGLTKLPSEIVQSYRVAESPIQMECRVENIITLGEHGGAGHLIICRVLLMHIDERIMENNRINPHKADLMGRMGRAYYVRASGDAISTIVQPVTKITIGYDNLPDYIKMSSALSGNDLGLLSGIEALPTQQDLLRFLEEDVLAAQLFAKKDKQNIETEGIKRLHSAGPEQAILMLMLQAFL